MVILLKTSLSGLLIELGARIPAMGPEGSIAKLLWSETEQHVTELASEVLGPDALTGPWLPWTSAFSGSGQNYFTNISCIGTKFFRVRVE